MEALSFESKKKHLLKINSELKASHFIDYYYQCKPFRIHLPHSRNANVQRKLTWKIYFIGWYQRIPNPFLINCHSISIPHHALHSVSQSNQIKWLPSQTSCSFRIPQVWNWCNSLEIIVSFHLGRLILKEKKPDARCKIDMKFHFITNIQIYSIKCIHTAARLSQPYPKTDFISI